MIEELPRGYAGFKNAICLKELFKENTGLCVITGKNGSGKTKLLNYCYDKIRENNRNNRNIAIFRQANYNWDVEEDEFYSFYRYKGRKNSSFIDIILDNIIDESKDIDNKEQLRTILFSDNDYYKSLREKICNDIFPKILKKYIGENDIKKIIQNLGYPSESQIKAEIREQLQKIKKQEKKSLHRGIRVRLSNHEKKELEEEIEKKTQL